MELKYKNFPVKFIKSVDDNGTIEAYVSTFDSEPDKQKDIMDPGCFTKSLEDIPTPIMLWNHGRNGIMPIGKWTKGIEDSNGLLLTGKISIGTTLGKDVYQLMKDGVVDTCSIGYNPVQHYYDAKGINHYKEVEVHEASPVAFPANPNARIMSVKSIETMKTKDALDGSFEERDKWIYNALREMITDEDKYFYVVATFSDHVIYSVEGDDNSYTIPYTMGTEDVTLGEPEAVELTTTVVPKSLEQALLEKSGARNSTSDMSNIQDAHDHSVALGADCDGDVDASVDNGKSDPLSLSIEEFSALFTKAGARNSKEDMAHIQAIHDAASKLGANHAPIAVNDVAPKSADNLIPLTKDDIFEIINKAVSNC
jgi:HK97 family phage prohead protease